MNKRITKMLSLLLVLIFSISAIASCTRENDTNTDSENASSDVQESTSNQLYDANGYLKDGLPETYNWGSDFTIYSWSNMKDWEWVEEVSTESTSVQLRNALHRGYL